MSVADRLRFVKVRLEFIRTSCTKKNSRKRSCQILPSSSGVGECFKVVKTGENLLNL